MSAIFAALKRFTTVSANETPTAPLSRCNVDAPGLVWRSTGLAGVYATLRWDGSSIDTIALVGTNLRAGDLVRIRIGSSQAVVDGDSAALDITRTAWSGVAPVAGALTVFLVDGSFTGPFVRIDISSPGNPAGFVEVGRIVLSQRITCDGVGLGADQTVEDGSVVEDGPGYTTVDYQRVRTGWKVTVDRISEADYYGKWWPMLMTVGKSSGFLFIPDADPAYLQNQAVFGRMTSSAKGNAKSSDFYIVDMSILSV